jgi:hypothetical protein
MPDPSPQPSTGVEPSAEAVEAATNAVKASRVYAVSIPGEKYLFVAPEDEAYDVLKAGLVIDSPAIHAAGVLEGRAAMRDEIVEWLRSLRTPRDSVVANAIEAAFPTTGEKTDG